MKLRIEIDLQLSPLQKRIARWGVVAGVVVGAIGLGAAFAGLPTDTSWIAPGAPVKAAALAQNISDLQNQFYDPPCPMNYTEDPNDGGSPVVCERALFSLSDGGAPVTDQVVKVGSQWSAFWIDRFEASVWANNGTWQAYGGVLTPGYAVQNTYLNSFLRNGQGQQPPFSYAYSVYGQLPSGLLSWFQAAQACAASGKRLPTGQEWLLAAAGTPDPGSNYMPDGLCITGAQGPNATGSNDLCVSEWGAVDMIGNLWEWTGDWFATMPSTGGLAPDASWPDPFYHQDGLFNVTSSGLVDQVIDAAAPSPDVPTVALRGGAWDTGTGAGVFAMSLAASPAAWDFHYGFRCVIPR